MTEEEVLETTAEPEGDVLDPIEETEPAEPVVEADATGTGEEGVTVNVTITQPEAAPATVEEDPLEDPEAVPAAMALDAAYTVTSPTVLEDTESGDGDPVMVDVITSILGEYRRQTYTVEQYDSSGDLIATSTEYVPGLAGLDWAWIAGAIFFGLVLSAGFKLLGGLIRS